MADSLNSTDNTLKLFQSNRSHSPTSSEEGNSSDNDISGTTPQINEDDMSTASVAFNTVPRHDVMTDLMKRTEKDSSKAEEEEEVKSKPKDVSAGNGLPKEELSKAQEEEEAKPKDMNTGNGSPKEESSKAEEEEVKSKPKDTSAGNGQDEPAVGAAATEDDEVRSKSKSSSLDSVCHDHVSARVSRTQSATCSVTEELEFEVPCKNFKLSAKTWKRTLEKLNYFIKKLEMWLDPNNIRDNQHRTELRVKFTLTNETCDLLITVKTKLLDPSRGSDCQGCKEVTCRFNAEKESGKTCLGHDEQTFSVKDEELVQVEMHLAPQNAIDNCSPQAKVLKLYMSITVEFKFDYKDWIMVSSAADN